MKNREVIVGVVLVALIAAGVYLVRSRPVPSERSSTAPGGPAADDDALPDVTLADAFVDAGDVRITLSLTPNPPVALAKMRVRVSASAVPALTRASADTAAADEALPLENGRISFEMVMPMGDHRYTLVPGAEGWQEAEVVLPT